MLSTEWGAPSEIKRGFDPADVQKGEQGKREREGERGEGGGGNGYKII